MKVGKRITIRGSGQVEAAVITAGPPGTVWFRNKMERIRPRAVAAADNAGHLQLGKFGCCLLEAKRIQMAGLSKNWQPSGVDVVLNTMMRRKVYKIGGENSGESVKKILEGRRKIRKRMEHWRIRRRRRERKQAARRPVDDCRLSRIN